MANEPSAGAGRRSSRIASFEEPGEDRAVTRRMRVSAGALNIVLEAAKAHGLTVSRIVVGRDAVEVHFGDRDGVNQPATPADGLKDW